MPDRKSPRAQLAAHERAEAIVSARLHGYSVSAIARSMKIHRRTVQLIWNRSMRTIRVPGLAEEKALSLARIAQLRNELWAALTATDDPYAKASLGTRVLMSEARIANLLGLNCPARLIVDANDMTAADREAEREVVDKLKELSVDELRAALCLPPDKSKLN